MTKAIVKAEVGPSLLQRVGNRYGLEPAKVYDTLCKTAFKDAKNQEQVIALLVVADQYHLNPFTREIYAFPDKGGGIVPVVGIDGWLRIINDHPQFDGMEFAESEETTTVGQSNPAPEWMDCIIYRKDRSHPVVIREYLIEVFRNTPAWNQTTARMLRHRCIMQCARVAFGFGGIVDPNDAEIAAGLPLDGVTVEIVHPPIGLRSWKKLVAGAKRFGYTEADVLFSAETAGHDGPGAEMSEDLAQRLYSGMEANPKSVQPSEQQPAESVDEDTGEIIPPEEAPQARGHATPFSGEEDE
jgi:phage recombination protein Bet